MGVLAFAVFQGWTADFDRQLLTSIGAAMRAAHWPILPAIAITTLGSAGVRLPLAAFVALLMLWRGDREGGAIVVMTTIGTLILTALLKIAASRARPDLLPQLVHETSFSFPSGHSANGVRQSSEYLAGRRCGTERRSQLSGSWSLLWSG
jgi:undecaprenyl-diphosphatase